ncbi:TLC domain-containing protein [Immersiella caudata]|uniref:TLC domain-containing protein n=1 Tax=Immersiella caudata TaxID=314043 RepID=A0AA39XCF1_9PEZI|nr:TLC domain-containing protein [Immersiella caudata]
MTQQPPTTNLTSILSSSSTITSLSLSLNLRTLPPHLPSILLSTLSFTLLHLLSTPLSHFLLPKTYPSFPPSSKTDWNLRVVSLIQSLILGPLSLYILTCQFFIWPPRGLIERVYGYYELETQMTDIALGYFLWHFAMMLKEYKKHGMQMVLHAMVGVGCMGGVYVPFTASMTAWFLVYEVTNVPHNVYRFLVRLGRGDSMLSVGNAVVWILLFFVFRIVWGTYATVAYMWSTWMVWRTPLTREGLGEVEFAVVERGYAGGVKLCVVLFDCEDDG